jgi:hypothetical protein
VIIISKKTENKPNPSSRKYKITDIKYLCPVRYIVGCKTNKTVDDLE